MLQSLSDVSVLCWLAYTSITTLLTAKLLEATFGLQFIGLTGGIATGKSTTTAALTAEHFNCGNVIDFDLIARAVVEPGQPAHTAIVKQFGSSVLKPDRTLDRAALGAAVFGDKQKLKQLNTLMNSPIMWRFAAEATELFFSKRCGEVLLDVPLLFEVALNRLCTTTLIVCVKPETQVQRLIARDACSSEAAEQRIAAQWSLDRKRLLATHAIDNDGTQQELLQKLKLWVKQHTQLNCRHTGTFSVLRVLRQLLLCRPTPVPLLLAVVTIVPLSSLLYITTVIIKMYTQNKKLA